MGEGSKGWIWCVLCKEVGNGHISDEDYRMEKKIERFLHRVATTKCHKRQHNFRRKDNWKSANKKKRKVQERWKKKKRRYELTRAASWR